MSTSTKGSCGNGQNGGEEVLRKGPWMPEEDEILVEYVNQYGPRDWSSIRSKGLLPRTGKSCRLRWVNKLKPDLKRSGCKFSVEEENLVVEMQAKLGNKWAKIASYLPGRTDNDVKNFWSTRQKRLLRALQRPLAGAGPSSSSCGSNKADSAASSSAHFQSLTGSDHLFQDSMDPLSKNHCFNEFAAFQVQSPTRPGSNVLHSGFPNTFMQLEGEGEGLFIRGQPVGDLRRLRHPGGGYNVAKPASIMGGSDDVFMVKLQDLVPNESVAAFMDSSSNHSNQKNEDIDHKVDATLTASKNARSTRNRRPRSRRESFRTGFESIVAENSDMQLLLGGNAHNQRCMQDLITPSTTHDHMALQSFNAATPHGQAHLMAASSCSDLGHAVGADAGADFKHSQDMYPAGPPSNDQQMNVFLNMQLHYDSCCSTAPTTASTISAGGRPDSPGLGLCCLDQLPPFALSQWDKLPLLYPEEPSLPVEQDCTMINVKEEVTDSNSCSPDSVLVSFPSDVFDSLEPLSPASSEWWQR